MKRDARIGLAVVLVLGLSVTMLIGRAIYKRGGAAVDDGDMIAETGTDGGTRLGDPPPANANQPQNPSGINLLNLDAQRLLDRETRDLERPAPAPAPANPTTGTPVVRRNEQGEPTTSDLDHESPTNG